MPDYRCYIIDEKGKKTNLIKEAASENELIVSFNNTNQTLVRCRELDVNEAIDCRRSFNRAVVLEFTEIMASLLKSGITIQDAVGLCISISANPKTGLLGRSILQALQNGLALHEALKMHSSSFSPLYRSMIRMGEKTGSVALVFSRMNRYLRNEKKLRDKIGNAVWYPALVLAIAVMGSFGIMLFILPRMTEIFSSFNIGSDESVAVEVNKIYFSLCISAAVFITVVCLAFLTAVLRKTSEHFAYFVDYFLLSMPIFGGFIKSIQTMNFAFTMEMLTGSGITVNNALAESAAAAGNRAYAKSLREIHSQLQQGKTLSLLFTMHEQFPPYIPTWIAVGERTGEVRAVFTQIREFFQDDVTAMSEKMMNMLEPSLILLTGIIIILMILQFVLPIFSLYGRLL